MFPDEKIYNQFSNNTPWRWHRLKLSQSRLMVGPLGAQRATACGRAGKLAALWSWLELGLPVQEDTQHLVTEAEMGRAWVCWPSSLTCYRQGLVLGRMAVEQHQIFLWFSLLLNMERRKTREGKKEKQETNWRCKSISMETRQNKKTRVFSKNSQAHRKGLHREWPQVLPDRMPSQQFSSTQHIVFPCCVICSLTLFFLFYKLLPRSHIYPSP